MVVNISHDLVSGHPPQDLEKKCQERLQEKRVMLSMQPPETSDTTVTHHLVIDTRKRYMKEEKQKVEDYKEEITRKFAEKAPGLWLKDSVVQYFGETLANFYVMFGADKYPFTLGEVEFRKPSHSDTDWDRVFNCYLFPLVFTEGTPPRDLVEWNYKSGIDTMGTGYFIPLAFVGSKKVEGSEGELSWFLKVRLHDCTVID